MSYEHLKAVMKQRFVDQLNDLEKVVLAAPNILDLCFSYYMEGYLLALTPEYEDVDDCEYELSDALKRIPPERLNELLKEELPNAHGHKPL